MKKILLITAICFSSFFLQAQEKTLDTLGYYEFIETVRGNNYVSEAPIVKDKNYIKWYITKNTRAPQTLEIHPDRVPELKKIFDSDFASYKSKYLNATENDMILLTTIKASSIFYIGKECFDMEYRDIDVFFSFSISESKKFYSIILKIPSYEDLDDPIYKSKPKAILITEAGVRMINESLSKY